MQHWSRPMDAQKEWKRVVDRAVTVVGGKSDDLITETYTDETLPVTRITLKSGQTTRIDIAQRDNDVFLTITPSEAHLVRAVNAAAGRADEGRAVRLG